MDVLERIRLAESSHVIGRLGLEYFDERVDVTCQRLAAREQYQVERWLDVLISKLDGSFSDTTAGVVRTTHVAVTRHTTRTSHGCKNLGFIRFLGFLGF